MKHNNYSLIYGVVAQVFSMRWVMVISSLLTALCCLCFGFSFSLWWAVLFRILGGFFNGSAVSARAYLACITDQSNQAYAWAGSNVAWGLGSS